VQAIHIDTAGIESPDDAVLLEAILRMLAGVTDVASVRSIGLVSVLYDEHKTGPRGILRAIRSSGFDARLVRPGIPRTRVRGAALAQGGA